MGGNCIRAREDAPPPGSLRASTALHPPLLAYRSSALLFPFPGRLLDCRHVSDAMKHSLELSASTRPEWVNAVMSNFPAFLQDHADCERKASAMAMSFVAKYPDRVEIIPELIETAIEELDHFQQVYAHMARRGVGLAKEMSEDPYIKALLELCGCDPI